jgi:hypothetical protein
MDGVHRRPFSERFKMSKTEDQTKDALEYIKNDPIVKPLDEKPVYQMSMHSKDYVTVLSSCMRRAYLAGVAAAEKKRIRKLLK